jgi:hypothetical protein
MQAVLEEEKRSTLSFDHAQLERRCTGNLKPHTRMRRDHWSDELLAKSKSKSRSSMIFPSVIDKTMLLSAGGTELFFYVLMQRTDIKS